MKVLERQFYGIAKGIGDSFDLSLLKNCSGVAEPPRLEICGVSRSLLVIKGLLFRLLDRV